MYESRDNVYRPKFDTLKDKQDFLTRQLDPLASAVASKLASDAETLEKFLGLAG